MSNDYNVSREEKAQQLVGELKDLAAGEIGSVCGNELDEGQIERLSDVEVVLQSASDGTFSWPEAHAVLVHVDIRHGLSDMLVGSVRLDIARALDAMNECVRSEFEASSGQDDLFSRFRPYVASTALAAARTLLLLEARETSQTVAILEKLMDPGPEGTLSATIADVLWGTPVLPHLRHVQRRARQALLRHSVRERDWTGVQRVLLRWCGWDGREDLLGALDDVELETAATAVAELRIGLEKQRFDSVDAFADAWHDLLRLINDLWAECVERGANNKGNFEEGTLWPHELPTNTRPYWAFQFGFASSRMTTALGDASGRLEPSEVYSSLVQDYDYVLGWYEADLLMLGVQRVDWSKTVDSHSLFIMRQSPENLGYGIVDVTPMDDEYWAMRCGLEKGQQGEKTAAEQVRMTTRAEESIASIEDLSTIKSIVEAISLRQVKWEAQLLGPIKAAVESTRAEIEDRLPLTMGAAGKRVEKRIQNIWPTLPEDAQVHLALAEKHSGSGEHDTAILDYTRAVEATVHWLIESRYRKLASDADLSDADLWKGSDRGRRLVPLHRWDHSPRLDEWAWNLENAIGNHASFQPPPPWKQFVMDAADNDRGAVDKLAKSLRAVQKRRGGSAHYRTAEERSRWPTRLLATSEAVFGSDEKPGALRVLVQVFGRDGGT